MICLFNDDYIIPRKWATSVLRKALFNYAGYVVNSDPKAVALSPCGD